MFIHWGLYALPGGRHNGKVMEYIGEWFQSYFRMPNEEYAKFAGEFNPVKFNADDWIRKAAGAGVKYIVFTTKHHDGFCMYDTKISDYNIVKMTPFGRDPLRELQHACARYGVKLGVYYSHHLDWHEKDGGDPAPERGLNCGNMHWGNDWDFPNRSEKNFANYFYGKVIPQITELLTSHLQLLLKRRRAAGNCQHAHHYREGNGKSGPPSTVCSFSVQPYHAYFNIASLYCEHKYHLIWYCSWS